MTGTHLGGWKKLYNEVFLNLCCSSGIIIMTELIMIRWEGHVAHIGEWCMQGFVRKPKGIMQLEHWRG
jgi:hypothetical protein